MSGTSSRLDVRLLGPIEVVVDGHPLEVDTRKAVALLAYLATERRAHTRGHLGDLLWPTSDPPRARAALRRTLSTLRASLGDRWVEADRDSVRFVSDDGVVVDLDVVRASGHDGRPGLSDLGTLQTAARVVRGPFMEGFGLRDAPAFDDWMMSVAEQVRREVSALFERLSAVLAEEGRYEEAIAAARRRLDADALHEGAYRAMMLLNAWAGDRAGAVAAYRECVAVLGTELGVEPLEETVELYEAILDGDLPRAPARTRRPAGISSPPIPSRFVGRRPELDRLLVAATRGAGVVIVEGELGMGKTRLLDEFVRQIGDGVAVMTTAGHRATSGVPYGPVQELLSDLPADERAWSRVGGLPAEVLREAARLAPAFGDPPPPTPDDPAARTRFVDALATVVGGAGDRVVLVVDDLHYCDDATLEFVGYLSTRLTRLGVLLVLAVRPEDVAAATPVATLLARLTEWEWIRLEPLDSAGVRELLDGADADPDDVYRRSGGVPFFAVEYAGAVQQGAAGESVAVRRLLTRRLAGLESVTRQVISAAAVIGAPADLDLVRAVSGRSEDEVVGAIEQLIVAGMFREGIDGSVAFVHEQLRDLAYEATSLVRRRLLHRRVAEHLLARREAAADPMVVAAAAEHQRSAGNDVESALLSVRAGDLAVDVYALSDAVIHYEMALALDHPDDSEVFRRIGRVQMLAGSYGAALSAYESARARLHMDGRASEAAALGHEVGEIYRRLHRWAAAAVSFEEAWPSVRSDPAAASRLAADWAYVERQRGDDDRAGELASVALAEAEKTGEPDVSAHAFNLAGMLESDPISKRAYLERALAAAIGPAARAAVLNNLALSFAAAGDLETAVEHARRALDLMVVSGDRHRTAALYDNLADFLHRAGDEEEAMASLKSAVALFSEVGSEPGSLEPEIWLLKQW